jgi:hypothetical protein
MRVIERGASESNYVFLDLPVSTHDDGTAGDSIAFVNDNVISAIGSNVPSFVSYYLRDPQLIVPSMDKKAYT